MNTSNRKETWIDCYNSSQKILLVGECDFSFSACLARAFRTAKNMVPTSYLDEDWLVETLWTRVPHLEELERLGCLLLYEVDVYKMHTHPILKKMKFDSILFNFPHAGHYDYLRESDQELIQELVGAYFRSASKMLSKGGEVYIRHRDDPPYYRWDVISLAAEAGLKLKEKVLFDKSMYPGYHHKRGGGINTNKTFPIGYAFTFQFVLDLPKVDDPHLKSYEEVQVLEAHDKEVCVLEMKDRVHGDEVHISEMKGQVHGDETHAMKIKDQVHEDPHDVQSLEMKDQVHDHLENDGITNHGDEVHVLKMKGQVHGDDQVHASNMKDDQDYGHEGHVSHTRGQVHDESVKTDHYDEILMEMKDDVDDYDNDINAFEMKGIVNEQHEKTSDQFLDVYVLKMEDEIHDYEHHMKNDEVNVDLDVHVLEMKDQDYGDEVHVSHMKHQVYDQNPKNDEIPDHDDEVDVSEMKYEVEEDGVHVLEMKDKEKNDQVHDVLEMNDDIHNHVHEHNVKNDEVNVDLVVYVLERMNLVEEQHTKDDN
ncbi:unnamed protein product [Lactuca saligna]|uniref:25S rRNA (uridine-N(3))-methyltransferase BMT5-like domain-containing protein n=1 Tax=Lactuca saligna TaxID=75948 RepID=A0AA36A3I7_LACSI|nr:unnamed protein product [Lactuca saligna]